LGLGMFEALETGIGLDIVQWFQTLRFGLLDSLALFFDFANDGLFYVVIIGAIYWMFNKQLGIRMLFALIISGIITLFFKDLLARPRPYEIINSGIIPLITESTFGIPSGHASMTLVIWGYFAIWMKKRPITYAVIAYVTLQGLSRMYLGVHFPQDVIAGWLLGGVILWMYATQIDHVIVWWHVQSLLTQIGVPVVFGILSMLFFLIV
jgi:membrane-associated phospholipid phosphatase